MEDRCGRTEIGKLRTRPGRTSASGIQFAHFEKKFELTKGTFAAGVLTGRQTETIRSEEAARDSEGYWTEHLDHKLRRHTGVHCGNDCVLRRMSP